jgi:hypothetical protein
MADTFESKVVSWTTENVIQNPLFLDQHKMDKDWNKKFPAEQLTSIKKHFNSALPGSHVD